jgi:hypothetical protein
MALDPDIRERLSVLAREIAAQQKADQWWQRVTVHDLPPPVPWELIDLTQPNKQAGGRMKKGSIQPK